MSVDATTPARVVEDARLLLRTVRDEVEEGRRPYMSDIRRLVERGLALKFPAYVQFLERYGFLTLDRRADLLAVTRAGEAVITGREGRLKSLEDDARYHFGEQLHEAPAPKRRSTGVRLDTRYLRLESIGRGGLGRVWRGRLLSVDRPVAIKMLDAIDEMFRPDQRERVARRFERAVREHAQLVSPYIVQIIDQNAQHDPPYFVMELAPGGNLKGLLERGPLAPPVALRYFIQIALGLKAAHALGVVHRDLKPENVLLDAAGNVKLSDFGVTRVAERDGATMRRAYVGYGSVGYMAPELLRGEAEGSPASDVYALGILLYEMLTGSLPGRRSPLPSDVVDGLPTAVDEIFDHMARDDIEGRLSSIDAVLDAVYGDDSIRALLDVRGAPGFIDPPLPLPGLPEGELPEGGDDEARDLAPTPPPSGVAPPEERPVSASRPPERVGDRPVDRPRRAGAGRRGAARRAGGERRRGRAGAFVGGVPVGRRGDADHAAEELESAPAEAAALVEARRAADAGGWALPDEAPTTAAASARTVLIDVAELTARRDDDAPRTDPPAAFAAPAADDGGDEEAGSVDDDADDDGSAFGADWRRRRRRPRRASGR
ncbi:MAG: protein kinase [Myxococcales bacterium]|nr:protein kinase [Myxococcales bacterium]